MTFETKSNETNWHNFAYITTFQGTVTITRLPVLLWSTSMLPLNGRLNMRCTNGECLRAENWQWMHEKGRMKGWWRGEKERMKGWKTEDERVKNRQWTHASCTMNTHKMEPRPRKTEPLNTNLTPWFCYKWKEQPDNTIPHCKVIWKCHWTQMPQKALQWDKKQWKTNAMKLKLTE